MISSLRFSGGFLFIEEPAFDQLERPYPYNSAQRICRHIIHIKAAVADQVLLDKFNTQTI